MTINTTASALYFYLVTFEITPEDEKDFNEIYDTEHIPNILQVEGVMQVIRLRDAEPTPQGWLKYSALYLIARVYRTEFNRVHVRSQYAANARVSAPALRHGRRSRILHLRASASADKPARARARRYS